MKTCPFEKAYMIGRVPLTAEEELVLNSVKRMKGPVGEHQLHMLMNIVQDRCSAGIYKFVPEIWERLDEKYQTGLGSLPYSSALHGVVESLVKKGYLSRASENPIVIYPDTQLHIF